MAADKQKLFDFAEGMTTDVPLDALVYSVHPALAPPIDASYPYGPGATLQSSSAKVAAPPPPAWLLQILAVANSVARIADRFIAALQKPPDFVVPKTFGMSAILGIMTALAIVDGCLYWLNAWPVFYFFFGIEAITICLAQMLYGQAPRIASIVAGAVILPVFTMVASMFDRHAGPAVLCLIIPFVPFGALLGYLTGTCAAGIFLVMDYFEQYLQGTAHAKG